MPESAARPRRFPDSSKGDRQLSPRIQSAGIRAINAWAQVGRMADALSEEISETTAPHGIAVTELSDEDSMVVAVASLLPKKRAETEH